MKRVILIDSNYLCHRSFHSTNRLQYSGVPTGVIFGFFNQLIKMADSTRPDEYLFFWDSRSSKRKEIFPLYKENRSKKQLSEIEQEERKAAYKQFNMLRKTILPEIGFFNTFMQKGYESDDLMARYVLDNYKKEEIIIATADDDMLQLLDYCKIYNLYREKIYTAEQFKANYGIKPLQWIDVKKIAGCSSDNVPGIPGVGEKTAIKFLTKGLKEDSKAYKDITSSPEVAEFNHKLVSLPFDGTKKIVKVKNEFNTLAFLRMCRKYGMYSFREEGKKALIKQLFIGGNTDGEENKRNGRERSERSERTRKERKESGQESRKERWKKR